VIECLQLILLRVADDLSQYQSPAAMSVIRHLLTGDCVKVVLGQMQSHSRVPHIKAALRLLSTMTSVSDVAARKVMTHFEALQPALLRFLYRKSVSDVQCYELMTVQQAHTESQLQSRLSILCITFHN